MQKVCSVVLVAKVAIEMVLVFKIWACVYLWEEKASARKDLGSSWSLDVEILIQYGYVHVLSWLGRSLDSFVDWTFFEMVLVFVEIVRQREISELMLHSRCDTTVFHILNFVVKVVVVFILGDFILRSIGKTIFPLGVERRYVLDYWRRGGAHLPLMDIRGHKAALSVGAGDLGPKFILILHKFMLFGDIQSFHFLNSSSIHNFPGLYMRFLRCLFLFNITLYLL